MLRGSYRGSASVRGDGSGFMQKHFVPGLKDQTGWGLMVRRRRKKWNMRTKYRGRNVLGALKDPKSTSMED